MLLTFGFQPALSHINTWLMSSGLHHFLELRRIKNSNLFRISRLMARGERRVSIIPVSLILSSIQLFPKFGPQAPVSWSSSNVLESATSFYVNSFSDRFLY